MIIRADLHMHGPIDFQPYWLKKQGYAGKNLFGIEAQNQRLHLEKFLSIRSLISR